MFGNPGSEEGRSGAARRRWLIGLGVAALLLIVGVTAFRIGGNNEIPYSELKQRIQAGAVAEVRVGANRIEALPTATALAEGAPQRWISVPVQDDALPTLLELNDVTYTGIRADGANPFVVIPVILMGGAVAFLLIRRQRRAIQEASKVAAQHIRDVTRSPQDVDFTQVAGTDEAKYELTEVVGFLKDPDRFARLGARIPKGVLLVGPPGTGKTLLAKAVAGEAGVPFFSLSGSEFVEMYVGVGASRVRKLFERARAKAPCIVFIDELDAVGRSRSGPQVATNDERESTLNQLLVEMDGFDTKSGIVLVAATNRPEVLDAALLRPGRFDRQVLVDRPDRQGREEILEVHARKIKLSDDVDLAAIARRTPGFVGADLANLLNEAALLAARHEQAAVRTADIDAALDRIVTGLEKKNKLVHEKERPIVAYHEAGHALVAEAVETAEPVKKISIIPRGFGALGFMQQIPDERFLLQHDELLDRLAVLLGGRAAERVVFGQVSTGASNDLERATTIARRMVCEFGMSELLGPVALASNGGESFLPSAGQTATTTFSEETAREIDREIQMLVTAAADRAEEILRSDRELLETVARKLLDDEVIEQPEFNRILAEHRGEELVEPSLV
jgi:cell division protease FtsH